MLENKTPGRSPFRGMDRAQPVAASVTPTTRRPGVSPTAVLIRLLAPSSGTRGHLSRASTQATGSPRTPWAARTSDTSARREPRSAGCPSRRIPAIEFSGRSSQPRQGDSHIARNAAARPHSQKGGEEHGPAPRSRLGSRGGRHRGISGRRRRAPSLCLEHGPELAHPRPVALSLEALEQPDPGLVRDQVPSIDDVEECRISLEGPDAEHFEGLIEEVAAMRGDCAGQEPGVQLELRPGQDVFQRRSFADVAIHDPAP